MLKKARNLRGCKGVSEEECRIIMKKVISGLKDLYDFDIVHRDLKLANILLHFPT
jgi:serine/threonine protein kinase